MAEEFQNTILLYGPVDKVEASAQQIGEALFKKLNSGSTEEFIFLWNGAERPKNPQEILNGCLADSVVFEESWAKISLAFQTRRGALPAHILMDIMTESPELFMEIQTIGDCSGVTGILAKEGRNLAIRQLELGADCANLTSLFNEYHSFRVGFPNGFDLTE